MLPEKEYVILPLNPLPEGIAVWPITVGLFKGAGGFALNVCNDCLNPHVVARGEGYLRVGGRTYPLRMGDVFCLWPHVPYEFGEMPGKTLDYYWMHLIGPGREAFARGCGFGPDFTVVHPRAAAPLMTALQALLNYAQRGRTGDRNPYRLLAQLYEIAALLRSDCQIESIDRQRRTPAQLVDHAEHLFRALLSTGINITDVAKHLRASRNTLFRAFLRVRRRTPHACLEEIRLDHARELLTHTSDKLVYIAQACGFANDKYFMRRFRRAEGISPAAWRRCQGRKMPTPIDPRSSGHPPKSPRGRTSPENE